MDPVDAGEELSSPRQEISLKSTFRAFQHRNYRLFFAGQLISLIGTWMTTTAEGWLVFQMTGSKQLLGIVAAASTAPLIFLSTVGGWVADHYPKRTILVITQIFSMIIALLFAFLVWQGSIQIWQILLLATFGGIVMAFDMPARQSFVIEITSREDLLNAISLNSAAFNGARVIGPSVAGILMAKLGIAACFLLDGLSFIAVIAGLLMIRVPAAVSEEKKKGAMLKEALEGFKYVWNHPRLFRIFTLFAIIGIFGISYSVILPAIASEILGGAEKTYGLLLAANGIGALLGSLTVATLGHIHPPKRLAFIGTWVLAIAVTLFAFSKIVWLSLILLAFAGFGSILFFSSANSAIQLTTEDRMRGRVMGIWALMFGAAVPLGSLEAGTFSTWIGSPATLILGGILSAAGAVYTFRKSRKAAATE